MIVVLITTVIFNAIIGGMVEGIIQTDPIAAELKAELRTTTDAKNRNIRLEVAVEPSRQRALTKAQNRTTQHQIRTALATYCQIAVFGGVLIALFVGVIGVSREYSRRSIAMVLARPVTRWQFLFGKYLGGVGVLFGYSIFIAVVLWLFRFVHGLDSIQPMCFIPWLAFCQFLILSSLALVISTVSNATLGVLFGLYCYLIWMFHAVLVETPYVYVYYALPSLAVYNVANQFSTNVAGYSWIDISILTLYAVDLVAVFLLLALWRLNYKNVY